MQILHSFLDIKATLQDKITLRHAAGGHPALLDGHCGCSHPRSVGMVRGHDAGCWTLARAWSGAPRNTNSSSPQGHGIYDALQRNDSSAHGDARADCETDAARGDEATPALPPSTNQGWAAPALRRRWLTRQSRPWRRRIRDRPTHGHRWLSGAGLVLVHSYANKKTTNN